MFKFCVAPGVNSKVVSNLLVDALYTKTDPFARLDISTSDNPPKVPPLPAIADTTFVAFLDPTLTCMSAILFNLW